MGGARGSPFLSVEILESSVQQSYQVMTEEEQNSVISMQVLQNTITFLRMQKILVFAQAVANSNVRELM